jgi:hypothetical protein
MGGYGSGWQASKKGVVNECLALDANRWAREGILMAGETLPGSWRFEYRGGTGFTVNYEVNTLAPSPFVRLWYTCVWRSTGQEYSCTYEVRLTTTRPRFGGVRWWFICPMALSGRPCGRRVGKLYMPPISRHFGCRHCHDLTYTSCQESHQMDGLYAMLAQRFGIEPREVHRLLRLGIPKATGGEPVARAPTGPRSQC